MQKFKYKYIQNWGTYSNQTLVIVGYDYKETLKILKRYKEAEPFLAILNEDSFDNKDFVLWKDGKTLLYLRYFEDAWDWYVVLMHEVHHLVYQVIWKQRQMDEADAQAYQFEFLFTEIRRKLYDKYMAFKNEH